MRFDLSAVKRVPIKGRVNVEFRAEFLNAFNTPWFTPVTGVGNDPDEFRVTDGTTSRTVRLVFRVNWLILTTAVEAGFPGLYGR